MKWWFVIRGPIVHYCSTCLKAVKVGHKDMVYGLFGDKFVWNFMVYCGKNVDTEEVACLDREESNLAYKVILDLNL
jgi:hypothetical protein